MRFTAPRIYPLWYDLLQHLSTYGKVVGPRGQITRETLGVTLVLEDLRENILVHPFRDLNYRYLVVEWLWVLLGMNELGPLTYYNGQMTRFSDDGATLRGAYGPHLVAQWDYVVKKLREDRDSRQAVVSTWVPNPQPSRDIPCTLTWQWLARQGKLHALINMRSSDVWLGIPYDIFVFSMVTNVLAGELGLETGSLTLNLGSGHLYERDVETAYPVLRNQHLGSTLSSPKLPGYPHVHKASLENLLRNRVGCGNLPTPWDRYERALFSPNKTQALDILKVDDER